MIFIHRVLCVFDVEIGAWVRVVVKWRRQLSPTILGRLSQYPPPTATRALSVDINQDGLADMVITYAGCLRRAMEPWHNHKGDGPLSKRMFRMTPSLPPRFF